MTVQKLTISIQPETIKQFKKLAKIQGYSISSWVNAKMDEELEEYKYNLKGKLVSGVDIAKAMYSAGLRLTIIREKLLPIYGKDLTHKIMMDIE